MKVVALRISVMAAVPVVRAWWAGWRRGVRRIEVCNAANVDDEPVCEDVLAADKRREVSEEDRGVLAGDDDLVLGDM